MMFVNFHFDRLFESGHSFAGSYRMGVLGRAKSPVLGHISTVLDTDLRLWRTGPDQEPPGA